jgi:hypothetical protein
MKDLYEEKVKNQIETKELNRLVVKEIYLSETGEYKLFDKNLCLNLNCSKEEMIKLGKQGEIF